MYPETAISTKDIRTRSFARDQFKLQFLDIGPIDAPTIILCHGLGAGKEQFERDARFFAQNGFRVIVPDLRGHGQSKVPSSFPETAFSLAAYAGDLIDLIEAEVGRPVHFVGNSLGGLIGLTLLRLKPSLVRSFASFGTTYSLKISPFVQMIAKYTNQFLPTEWVAKIGAKSISDDAETQEIMRRLLSKTDPQVTAKTMANIAEYDLRSVVTHAKVPLLLLKAEKDKQINEALGPTLQVLSTLNNAHIANVSGAGHCANLDAPEVVRPELLAHFERAAG
jgi:pimeloyl-ACP methyl ester carboxylesterase